MFAKIQITGKIETVTACFISAVHQLSQLLRLMRLLLKIYDRASDASGSSLPGKMRTLCVKE